MRVQLSDSLAARQHLNRSCPVVENGFALGSRGEKSAVFGESCLCEPPRKKAAWENCRRPVPSCTCDHHCPAPLQLTLIIEQRRRVEERVGLRGFHPLSPLASSPLAQSRGLGKSTGATWAKGSWGTREKPPLPQDLDALQRTTPPSTSAFPGWVLSVHRP